MHAFFCLNLVVTHVSCWPFPCTISSRCGCWLSRLNTLGHPDQAFKQSDCAARFLILSNVHCPCTGKWRVLHPRQLPCSPCTLCMIVIECYISCRSALTFGRHGVAHAEWWRQWLRSFRPGGMAKLSSWRLMWISPRFVHLQCEFCTFWMVYPLWSRNTTTAI